MPSLPLLFGGSPNTLSEQCFATVPAVRVVLASFWLILFLIVNVCGEWHWYLEECSLLLLAPCFTHLAHVAYLKSEVTRLQETVAFCVTNVQACRCTICMSRAMEVLLARVQGGSRSGSSSEWWSVGRWCCASCQMRLRHLQEVTETVEALTDKNRYLYTRNIELEAALVENEKVTEDKIKEDMATTQKRLDKWKKKKNNRIKALQARLEALQAELEALQAELDASRERVSVQEALLKNASTPGKCTICFEGDLELRMDPCGHVCLCTKCMQGMKRMGNKECPMCRREVLGASRIYL